MKSKISIIVLFLLVFFCVSQKSYALLNTAKATIFVVDEDGKQIEGARAGIAFEKNKAVEPGINIFSVDGLTDSEGRFTAQHGNDSNVIIYSAEKEGYYFSNGEYRFSDRNTFGWKPWNPELKVVLRKIENPVPMYARKTYNLKIPVADQEIGFDLIVSDWVTPYGKGLHSDLIFKLEKKFGSMKDFHAKLTVKFSNSKDGIIIFKEKFEYGSEMKLPKIAPENGYQNELNVEISRKIGGKLTKNYDNDSNYIFRIRSEKDKYGKLKSMYGKFHGPIKIETRTEPATIIFKYYVNPDYTRNLEFDPKRNLFGKLPDMEQVNEP